MLRMIRRGPVVPLLLALALSAGAFAGSLPATPPAAAQGDNAQLAQGLNALNGFAANSQNLLAQGDIAGARAAYNQFDTGWEAIEDGVRDRSRDAYQRIEDAMNDVYTALNANPVDAARATTLLGELQSRVSAFVATLGS